MAGKNKKTNDNTSIVIALLLCCAAIIVLVAVLHPFGGGKNNDTGAETDGKQSSPSSGSDTKNEPDGTAAGTDGTTADTPSTAGTEPSTDDVTDDTHNPPTGMHITTEQSTFDENGSHIQMIYPTVVSHGSADEITKTLRAEMDRRRVEELLGFAGGESNYKVENVSVELCRPTFVSLVVTGYCYVSESSHPEYFAYTINYDVNAKKLLTGEDLIKDFDAVREKFTGGGFRTVYGQAGLLDEMSYEDMITAYHAEYGIYPEVYYTSDGFGIAVELVYTLGGYALFETTQSSLSGAIYAPQI